MSLSQETALLSGLPSIAAAVASNSLQRNSMQAAFLASSDARRSISTSILARVASVSFLEAGEGLPRNSCDVWVMEYQQMWETTEDLQKEFYYTP